MKKIFLTIIVLGWSVHLFAQIDTEMLLELVKGTTAEMNAVSPAIGALIYNTEDSLVYRYDGTAWASISEDGDWTRSGNNQFSAVSGNVGIGVTSPITKLDVDGRVQLRADGQNGYVASGVYLNSHDDYRGAGIFSFGQTNDWFFGNPYTDHDGKFIIAVAGKTGNESVAQNTNAKFTVQSDGNVGIGINSPSTKLHVMGDIQLGGSDTRLIRFRNLANNDHASLGELNGGLVLSGHSAANVAGHEHLFINNSGNVGIGTITPSGKLHISSGTDGDAKLIIEADTDDNNEDDNPLIVFKQDGGIEESAIEQTHNELHMKNSISSGGGLVFDVGTTNGYENASEAMRVIPTGEVGIGTATPSEKLDIQGNVAHSGQLRSRGPNYTFSWMRFAEHQWGNSTILGAGGNTILGGGEFAWTAQPNFAAADEKLVLGSDYNIVFFTNTQSGWDYRKNVMTLTNTARVGINTDAPTVDLDVNGKLRIRDIPAGGGSQWLVKDANGNVKVQASDFRLKKNIVSIDNSLDKVLALDGKYFDWKDDGRHDIGFIAQDVEKVLPELVSETDDGYKALNYPQITAVLVNAVKELKSENDILRKQVAHKEFGAINATMKENGEVEFSTTNDFKVVKLGEGTYSVELDHAEDIANYSVRLSTSKTVLPNGDPVYINLVTKAKNRFEVKIQSVDKDRVMRKCDAEWSFDLRVIQQDSMILEASLGSIQE